MITLTPQVATFFKKICFKRIASEREMRIPTKSQRKYAQPHIWLSDCTCAFFSRRNLFKWPELGINFVGLCVTYEYAFSLSLPRWCSSECGNSQDILSKNGCVYSAQQRYAIYKYLGNMKMRFLSPPPSSTHIHEASELTCCVVFSLNGICT